MADLPASPNGQLVPVKDPNTGGGSFSPIPQMTGALTFRQVGSSGLRAFAGYVREEFLPQLQGRMAQTVYREMRENSPVIGGMIFAMEATMRKVEWRTNPADDSAGAAEAAEFADSLRMDMSGTWDDTISEVLSMVPYGFAPLEICYKRRLGRQPGMDPRRAGKSLPRSKYDDGRIGWANLPLRGQDTVIKWFFDENGEWQGLTQQPWTGPMVDIPMEKLLLFRPSQHKGNPEGRALDPETIIPTPDGWRRMDDLQVGDKVFDETGAIRYITARADWDDRPVQRLTFSDGFSIVADANHQWETQTHGERAKRRPGSLRTTAEIAASIKAVQGSSNHSIPWAGALDYPEQVLPFDPYLLGMWLGDGTSREAAISCHVDDLEETLSLVASAGYSTRVLQNGKPDGNGRTLRFYGDVKRGADAPARVLGIIGVLNNKHIPAAYLRGSRAQRLALLSGLMDSDGHVDNSGRCEFSNTNAGLAYGVAELVRSLGIGASLSEKANSHGNPAWLVKFTPTWVPFRLSRKAARCRTERQRMNHYIVSAEPLPARRTVCIEVDSPSHMFLAGEGMVPTHNSVIRNAYRSYYMVKRIEEQEAILYERLNGLPVIKVPASLMESARVGDVAAVEAMREFKNIAVNLRIDEQMGVILPSDTFEGPTGPSTVPAYSIELVAPGGGKGSGGNSNDVINRHNNLMMMSVLADFLILGHGPNGTEALAAEKKGMFFQATEGYLNSAAAVFNRHGLERVWELNGMDPDYLPEFTPDMAQEMDLDVLGNFLERLTRSGMAIFPNADLETALMDAAGLPDIADPAALEALGEDGPQHIVGPLADAASAELAPPPTPMIAGPGVEPGSPAEQFQKMVRASIARRIIKKQGNHRHGK